MKRRGHFISSADLSLSFLGIVLIIQMVTFRFRKSLSLEAVLTAPDLTFISRGVDP